MPFFRVNASWRVDAIATSAIKADTPADALRIAKAAVEHDDVETFDISGYEIAEGDDGATQWEVRSPDGDGCLLDDPTDDRRIGNAAQELLIALEGLLAGCRDFTCLYEPNRRNELLAAATRAVANARGKST